MALTLTQAPTIPAPLRQKLIFTATSTNVGNTGFRFKYTVTVDGVAHSVYVPPNPANSGMLDVRPIIEKYVRVDNTVSSTASVHRFAATTNVLYSRNGDNFRQVTVTILEAWEVAGVLTDDPDSAGSVGGNTYRIFAGSFQHYDGFNPAMTGYSITDVNSYLLSDRVGSTVDFPSKWKYAPNYSLSKGVFIPVNRSQVGCLAFQNWAGIDKFQYAIYEGTTIVGSINIDVNATNGLGTAALTNTVTGIGYIAAYPGNLAGVTVIQTAGLLPSQNPDWTHYTFQALNGITQVSTKYIFYASEECRFDDVVIGWANMRGGWDYMNFSGKSTQNWQSDPKRYRKTLGTYDAVSFDFQYQDRGLTDFGRETKRTLTVTKKNMTAADYQLLRSLMVSKEVYIIGDDANSGGAYDLPLVLQTSSLDIERMRMAGQKELSLTFEYANQVW